MCAVTRMAHLTELGVSEHELDAQRKASGLTFYPEALSKKKESPELSSNRISSESDRRHYCGFRRNRHHDLREPWLR